MTRVTSGGNRNRKFLYSLFCLPLVLGGGIFYGLHTPPFIIFPGKLPAVNPEVFTDEGWDGRSVVQDFSTDNGKLQLRYSLRRGADYPSVFINFWLDSRIPFRDLSAYDVLLLKVKQASSGNVILFLKTYQDGISRPGHAFSHTLRHNEVALALEKTPHSYRIPLVDFYTPEWWYNNIQVSREEVGAENFSRVVAFALHSIHRENTPVNESNRELVITRIALVKSPGVVSLIALFLVVSDLLAAGFLFLRNRRPNTRPHLVHKPLEIVGHRQADLKLICGYIEEHYHKPDISTRTIEACTGIPARRIYLLVKTEYRRTFKQLIHDIRMREAGRLLKETDLRITEIAFRVGFNEISYFNRLFKQINGLTPSEFRERSSRSGSKSPLT